MRTLKTQKSTGRSRRRRSDKFRRAIVSRARGLRTCCGGGGGKLSEKLRALKSLLPAAAEEEEDSRDIVADGRGVATEQLFQETADYIIRLRTQVLVLQRLVEIYGTHESEDHKDNVVL